MMLAASAWQKVLDLYQVQLPDLVTESLLPEMHVT